MLSRIKFTIVICSTFLTALLVIGAVMGESSSADGAYRQLSVYTEVLTKIKGEYVEEPDIKLVTRGALQGLLESLDSYSSYFTAEQYKEYEKRKAPQEGDIGLVISKRVGIVFTLAALPGSPAAKAGLSVGDQIDAIDGRATRELPLPLTEALFRGPVGSTVTLLTRRSRRNEEPQELTLTRAPVKLPLISSQLLPDKVGYLEIKALNTGKAAEASRALKDLSGQGAERLVLDLRNNAVGDWQEAAKLANLFVAEGRLGYLEGQKFPRQEFWADPRQASASKLPLVVITNRATSGPAELLAAALLDSRRGQIVGEKTLGLGAEAKTFPLDDGAALMLSVAKYYRPSGKALQDGGVNPTLQVNETDSDLTEEDAPPAQAPSERPAQADELLKKAIEVVKGATAA
jgi:carboxyl-terminal processing protease